MYSPKIAEEFIPRLYVLAKSRKMPMTTLVNGMIRDALADTDARRENGMAVKHDASASESTPAKLAA